MTLTQEKLMCIRYHNSICSKNGRHIYCDAVDEYFAVSHTRYACIDADNEYPVICRD